MYNQLQVVVGGQHGSEGKGHVVAQLASRQDHELITVRTGGPNAGHTVYGRDGQVHKLRQLPTATVSNPSSMVAIAAGSLINPEVLAEEVKQVGLVHHENPVLVDRRATILEPHHIKEELESNTLSNWSTQKGIGAARAARIRREAQTAEEIWGTCPPDGVHLVDVSDVLGIKLRLGRPVLVEAAQGYGLGLHTRFYPKTTSADCRAIDALADAGISPWIVPNNDIRVWVVLRPYPIRVAGDSGPLLCETTWEELGLEPEYTTVTKRVRRVGAWDPDLAREAIRANGGPGGTDRPISRVHIALTMLDQVAPETAGCTDWRKVCENQRAVEWIHRVESDTGARVSAVGTGPTTMAFREELTDGD